MKKHMKIILICLCTAFLIAAVLMLWQGGVIVFDRSAVVRAETVLWNGETYSMTTGEYTEGKTIAKSNDGSWRINEVEEDPSHKFLVARSFLDQALYVADSYEIPESGEITLACWNGEHITDEAFLNAVSDIIAQKTTSFEHQTDGIFALTDNQRMKPLYLAYEGCPIATQFGGYMGKINGSWVITTYISPDTHNEDGSWKEHSVGCYAIPEEHHRILQEYFFE